MPTARDGAVLTSLRSAEPARRLRLYYRPSRRHQEHARWFPRVI